MGPTVCPQLPPCYVEVGGHSPPPQAPHHRPPHFLHLPPAPSRLRRHSKGGNLSVVPLNSTKAQHFLCQPTQNPPSPMSQPGAPTGSQHPHAGNVGLNGSRHRWAGECWEEHPEGRGPPHGARLGWEQGPHFLPQQIRISTHATGSCPRSWSGLGPLPPPVPQPGATPRPAKPSLRQPGLSHAAAGRAWPQP